MRTLTSTLLAAQKAVSIDALTNIVLTYSSYSYIYTRTRILDITHTEDGNLQSCDIVLDNSDGVLTNLDLKGYKGVLSFGAVTSGDEYSACAPMWVIPQRFDSVPGKLVCTLSLVGICNLMADDKASESYIPDATDTKPVKTIINQILGATLACFSHCTAYTVVWDSEDSLINTYTPKDGFRIYAGGDRLSAVNRLLDYTKCVMRARGDGCIHIFVPTTSGATYDYEYTLQSGHTFFAKALRNRLVIPNYIKVMSRKDDTPQYSGTATDAVSYGILPKQDFYQTYLASNDQATLIAQAMLAKAQMWCEAGSADVPLNVGAEVYDYVKVTDQREGDYRVGSIGRLVRHYTANKNEWRMTFTFGNWQNVRKALADLGVTSDDLTNYFARLKVGDLYVENLDAYLDEINDGPDVYVRQKSLHLDATGVYLTENTLYTIRLPGGPQHSLHKQATAPSSPAVGDFWIDTNYIPNKVKMWNGTSWAELTAAQVAEFNRGTIYRELKSVALTADGLVVLDRVQVGTYGLTLSTALSAGKIKLSSAGLDTSCGYSLIKTIDIDATTGSIKASAIVQSALYKLVSEDQIAAWEGYADDAAQALLKLADIASDSKVTPVEKKAVKVDWDAIVDEKPGIVISATAVGVSTTAYISAYNSLNTYLNTTLGVFNDMSATTTVTRTTWNSQWESYFGAKVDILNAIYGKIYDLAANAYDIGVAAESKAEGNIMYGYANFNGYAQAKGVWYQTGGVKISGASGILIYGQDYALRTRATENGPDQCYVGSDGAIYAAAGNVKLDSVGITLKGETLQFYYGTGYKGYIKGVTGGLVIWAQGQLSLAVTSGGIDLATQSGYGLDLLGCDFVDLPQLSSAPAASDGRLFFNTAVHQVQVYFQGAWRNITTFT
ncbi:MAG: hypothetical protein ABSF21_00815 [Dehalococcoidia bacterium]